MLTVGILSPYYPYSGAKVGNVELNKPYECHKSLRTQRNTPSFGYINSQFYELHPRRLYASPTIINGHKDSLLGNQHRLDGVKKRVKV
jgi:hypothetical protein